MMDWWCTRNRAFRAMRIALALLLAQILTAGCTQSDLYTLVKDGVPVINAVANNDDATATIYIRATAGGYYAEYQTPVPASSANILHVTENGDVLIADSGTNIYIRDADDNGSWTTTSMAFTATFITSRGHDIYLIETSPYYEVYFYSRSSKSWSLYKTLTFPPSSVAVRDGRVYLTESSAGTISIYDMDSGEQVFPSFSQGPGATLRPLFLVGDNYYTGYISTDVIRMYTDGVLTAYFSQTGLAGNRFAISGGEVFASAYNGTSNMVLYRMSGSTFTLEYTFNTSTAYSILIDTLGPDTIAVGMSESMTDDGLYIYNHREKSMRQLSSRGIRQMQVR